MYNSREKAAAPAGERRVTAFLSGFFETPNIPQQSDFPTQGAYDGADGDGADGDGADVHVAVLLLEAVVLRDFDRRPHTVRHVAQGGDLLRRSPRLGFPMEG
eukprot:COSAG02_NODE_1297_length_13389_cov_6.460572_1_plen_102_part_00